MTHQAGEGCGGGGETQQATYLHRVQVPASLFMYNSGCSGSPSSCWFLLKNARKTSRTTHTGISTEQRTIPACQPYCSPETRVSRRAEGRQHAYTLTVPPTERTPWLEPEIQGGPREESKGSPTYTSFTRRNERTRRNGCVCGRCRSFWRLLSIPIDPTQIVVLLDRYTRAPRTTESLQQFWSLKTNLSVKPLRRGNGSLHKPEWTHLRVYPRQRKRQEGRPTATNSRAPDASSHTTADSRVYPAAATIHPGKKKKKN